jgi:ABC-2 type transport system permease protein
VTASASVGALRAAIVLTRLQLRRQINFCGSVYRSRRKSTAGRTATARKSRTGGLVTAFVVLAMIGNSINVAHLGVANLEKVLGTVQTYEEVRKGWLGVRISPVTAEEAKRLGLEAVRGALIAGLADDGPAKRAGLQAGDVVIRFNGHDVAEPRDLAALVAATPVGTVVQVAAVHAGKEERRSVAVGLLPQQQPQLHVERITPASGAVLASAVIKGAMLAGSLLVLAALLMTLASRDIAQPEWDFEWLSTLPLPLSTLLLCRLIERTLTNTIGLLVLVPFLSFLAVECGYGWSAPLIALGLTLPLLAIVAVGQTLADTGLRMSLSPPKLRNLQAVISIASVPPLLLVMAMVFRDDVFVFAWARALPDWVGWLPASLAVRALASADGQSMALSSAAMIGEVVTIAAVGYAVLHRQLRNGVAAAGAREAARGPRAASPAASKAVIRSPFSPVQRRELQLLSRDRTFLVQTLLLPVLIVGMQIFTFTKANIFVGAVEHPETLAAVSFGLAAYTLMMSAFQTLNAEGQALWILYTVPQSLEAVLREKAKLWASVATIYALLVFVVAAALAHTISLPFISSAAVALLGVPIFALIATALGVFGCDPLATDVRHRVRLTYLYLYMTLASLFGLALYASTVWQRLAVVVLTTLLAVALWQKARDQFDYLLDPTAAPPSRVSVSDGMIAALMFFVLQATVFVFARSVGDADVATALWIAFCTAGAVTYAAMRFVYWRIGTVGVPRLFAGGLPRALLWGAAGGAVVSIAGVAYIEVVSHWHLFPFGAAALPDRRTFFVLAAIAVPAAPVFEEFIFRGLIFGGLRRSLGVVPATLASAAIFAIIHPPYAVIPVFVLGVCAAVVYERTRILAAPMLVHAIYNATVLGFQWNVMQ